MMLSSRLHGTVNRFSLKWNSVPCDRAPDKDIWQNIDPDLCWACAFRNLFSLKGFNFLTFSFYIPRVSLYNAQSELLNKIFQISVSYFKLKYCVGRKGSRCWRYKVSITPSWSLIVVINIDLMTLLPKWRVNMLAKIFLYVTSVIFLQQFRLNMIFGTFWQSLLRRMLWAFNLSMHSFWKWVYLSDRHKGQINKGRNLNKPVL